MWKSSCPNRTTGLNTHGFELSRYVDSYQRRTGLSGPTYVLICPNCVNVTYLPLLAVSVGLAEQPLRPSCRPLALL